MEESTPFSPDSGPSDTEPLIVLLLVQRSGGGGAGTPAPHPKAQTGRPPPAARAREPVRPEGRRHRSPRGARPPAVRGGTALLRPEGSGAGHPPHRAAARGTHAAPREEDLPRVGGAEAGPAGAGAGAGRPPRAALLRAALTRGLLCRPPSRPGPGRPLPGGVAPARPQQGPTGWGVGACPGLSGHEGVASACGWPQDGLSLACSAPHCHPLPHGARGTAFLELEPGPGGRARRCFPWCTRETLTKTDFFPADGGYALASTPCPLRPQAVCPS